MLNQIAFKAEEEQTAKPPEEPVVEPEPQVLESSEPTNSFLDQLTEILVALLVGAIGIFIYRRWNAHYPASETEL